MRISDAKLAEVWDRGFTVVEDFLDADTLKAAQEAMWGLFPKPEAYFAAPEDYQDFSQSQFAGLRNFPYPSWELNRIPVYPDLIDAAERFLGATNLEIYKIELWAKYSGAINYDQYHHRDYGNHTLVVPSREQRHTQMTTFLLLSNVTDEDGPTKLVPQDRTRDIPLTRMRTKFGELFDDEVAATGPAGTLMIYKTDVFHRGSAFTAPGRSRFAMLTDFQERGWPWTGKMAWPNSGNDPGLAEALTRMTPRQRDLFGWPPAGSDYWTPQTLADVGVRYPKMDLTPYGA
jgi:ectoine hydroxylase-related dioxygenase (phytanoyl-CoA dioxygenase family)